MDHKNQHSVPVSYLKAWCDPNTPKDQDAYVWRFQRDGSDARRKAPHNIFHEANLYTINEPGRGRNLILENGLSTIEGAFVSIRDATLSRERTLAVEDHLHLCAFIAAAKARTPRRRDHERQQWSALRDHMDKMRRWAQTATPEQREIAAKAASPSSSEGRFSYDDVEAIAEKPLQHLLVPIIEVQTLLLMGLDVAILTSNSDAVFITSDNPCVWFDPEAVKRPPMFRSPALEYETIEVCLPVSPRQYVLLNRRGLSGYLPASPNMVNALNQRTRLHCAEYFVSNSPLTDSTWFDPGVEPDDSWEKPHGQSGQP